MGRYATVTEVQRYTGKAQLIWLSQPDRQDASTINTAVVEDAIEVAENEIDERLYESSYVVPLQGLTSTALVGIKRIAIQLAIWDMASGQQISNETQLISLRSTRKAADTKLTLYANKSSKLRCEQWYSNQTNSPMVVQRGRKY